MKIAMMTNNYKPFIGGVPISIERLSESLRGLGHQVVVFAPTYEEQLEEENVFRYHSLLKGLYNGVSLPNSLDPKIERRFKEEAFDVIHVHHPMMIGKTALTLSKKYGIPLVFTYHTRYEQYMHYMGISCLKGMLPLYIREFTKNCDVVAAPTPLMKSHLEEIGVETDVMVLPTGLQADSFLPNQEKIEAIRTRLARGKQYLFCTVARLAKEKNLEFLIRSLSLRKESGMDDFSMVFIGEGPEETHLRQMAAKYGLEDHCIFEGKVDNKEIKNYCAAADLFLFASKSETQGIVLLEAMAAKTPVLAVRATGTADIVCNGKNGYMTEESETEFADRLCSLLQWKELQQLKGGAYETALSYRTEEIAKRALIIYAVATQKKREKSAFGRAGIYGILSGMTHRT